eukprot:7349852-Prymnesium_polylepis.1
MCLATECHVEAACPQHVRCNCERSGGPFDKNTVLCALARPTKVSRAAKHKVAGPVGSGTIVRA